MLYGYCLYFSKRKKNGGEGGWSPFKNCRGVISNSENVLTNERRRFYLLFMYRKLELNALIS